MVSIRVQTESGQAVELTRLFTDFKQSFRDATMELDQGGMLITVPTMSVVSQRLLLWQFNHAGIVRYEMREE